MAPEPAKKTDKPDSEKKVSAEKEEQNVLEKPKSNLPLVIGILTGIIILEAIVLLLFFNFVMPKSAEEREAAKKKADSLLYSSETLTKIGMVSEPIEAVVNIAGTNGDRFLKVKLKLEFDEKKYPKLGEEISRRLPKFKSQLIDQISQISFSELNEPDAKTKIRKNFLRVVNNSLPTQVGEVGDVLLDEFIIQ